MSVLVAVPLLALNLRPAVTSVGAVLADIRSGTGMSVVLASVVVAAPVWCFAIGGALAYKLRARWGTSATVSVALVVLAATLACRVVAGPYVLLAGTVLACLAIAVLGTLLPVITHAAPTRAWALLTGCYVAAMGGGSGVGALITPQVSAQSTWQWGVSGWALLAAAAFVAWRVAARRFSEPPVPTGPRPSPFSLRPSSTAWSTTIHFGLTSGFTFSIMGWLPSILLDHSRVDEAMVGWMFTVAMALGVPIALLVPKWARASQSQSALAIALCAPNLLAMGGLLLYPEITPWVWAVGLGLGMPAVGLALTLISLRAAPDGDTAAALSSMVQGIGYAIAGATALAAGLLHSVTESWEWPLIGLLCVLCGQLISGMHAGLPVTVYSERRKEQPPAMPRQVGRPLGPPPRGPVSLPLSMSQPVAPLMRRPVRQPVLQPVSGPVSLPFPRPVSQPSQPLPRSLSQPPSHPSQPLSRPGAGSLPPPPPARRPTPYRRPSTPTSEPIYQPTRPPAPEPRPAPDAEAESVTQVVPDSVIKGEPEPRVEAEPAAEARVEPEPAAHEEPEPAELVREPEPAELVREPEPAELVREVEPAELVREVETRPAPERSGDAVELESSHDAGPDLVAPEPSPEPPEQVEPVRLTYPRQEALFDLPQQEALFEIPLPRAPMS